MFSNCINLKSVDFSKMITNYTIGDYFTGSDFNYNYSTEYFNRFDYMFNNCINIKIINISFNINSCLSAKNMFNNCISLTPFIFPNYLKFGSSKFFFSDFNNMFSNCISLKIIDLSKNELYHISDLNISYIFYNCSSLTSLNMFNIKSLGPYDMSYSFAYCSSLKYLYLEYGGCWGISMKYAFGNCSSLTSINLNFPLRYEDKSFLFFGCISLTHINLTYSNIYAKYMNYMFYDCHSLKYIYHPNYLTHVNYFQITDISRMFSGCFSLTSIFLDNLYTEYITNYEGLFYDCKNLIYVDISKFTHNNLSYSNLSIFNDNYPNNITIMINEEFKNRIKIPSNSTIIIKNY